LGVEIKMKLYKILLLSISAIPCVVFAGTTLPNKTIKNVIVNLNTGIHFQINETMENPDTCKSGGWYKISSTSTYGKEAFSLLLAYEAQKKSITIHLNGCTGGYPAVKYIY
jgi:hypothetical protein